MPFRRRYKNQDRIDSKEKNFRDGKKLEIPFKKLGYIFSSDHATQAGRSYKTSRGNRKTIEQ